MSSETLHSALPVIHTDPFATEVIRSPWRFHQELREAGPVALIEPHGNYAVGRYDEARTVLKDWETFTSTGGAGLSDIRKFGAWREPGPIVEADPPNHTQVRAVMSKIISPGVIRGWQEFFDHESSILADELREREEVNGAIDIAEAYVMRVFPKSLGLKVHRKNMVIAGNFNFNALGPKNELFVKSQKAIEEIADWYATAQQREGVMPGSFAEMIFLAEDAGELAPGVASGLVRTFLRGGMDTTISGIGSALMFLSERPALWETLRKDRSRLKFVFEESIRMESPVQSFFRTTTKDVDLGGIKLKADTKIQVFVSSANRDPRKWRNAEEFDIDRTSIPHLAFGHGVHVCIGQMIARMEAESVFVALLDRFKTLQRIGAPVHRPSNILRTLAELPLRFEPA